MLIQLFVDLSGQSYKTTGEKSCLLIYLTEGFTWFCVQAYNSIKTSFLGENFLNSLRIFYTFAIKEN